jgi:hypothetical protein
MSKRQDTWLQQYWRPMMAVAYMAIMVFDFIVAPLLWSILQATAAGAVTLQWVPLTLLSGGIFHAAMGAVLGISAFTRGQEKVERLRTSYQEGQSTPEETDKNDRQ